MIFNRGCAQENCLPLVTKNDLGKDSPKYSAISFLIGIFGSLIAQQASDLQFLCIYFF